MKWNGTDPYFILSLDGGGIWSVIQAMALQNIYGQNATGHDVLQRFNLVAANSGGSIVLAAMAMNMSLDQICGMFQTPNVPTQIFSKIPIESAVSSLLGFGPKYSTAAKRQAFQNLLPGANDVYSKVWANTGGGPSPDILIAAFDYDRCRATFFRSNLNSRAANFPQPAEVNLLDAINASSTAPVNYFDQPAKIGTSQYWDGAIAGYNNPVLAAVVEATANGVAANRIRALSLGTAQMLLPLQNDQNSIPPQLAQARYSTGNPLDRIKHDLAELAGSIIDNPPDAASFEAHVMLGQRLPRNAGDIVGDGTVVRMNPMIQPIYDADSGQWECPSVYTLQEFSTLANLPMDATAPNDVTQIVDLCMHWLNDKMVNQPIRANHDTLAVEIGHRWFSDALAAWQTLQEL